MHLRCKESRVRVWSTDTSMQHSALVWPNLNVVPMQVLRQQLDMLQHQVSQLSMHRQHWHQQQQEQAAIAASVDDTLPGASSSTDQASGSQQPPAEPPVPDGDANGQQNAV